MIASLYALLFGTATLTSAIPVVERRAVQALNQAAFAEAQQRDDTATRAFSSTEIKVSNQVGSSIGSLVLTSCRLQMGDVSSLMSYLEISVQI